MTSPYLEREVRTFDKALFDRVLNALIASTRNLRFAQMSVPNLRERELIGERIEANGDVIQIALEAKGEE